MFASLPNSCVEILTSSVAALGAEAFGKRLGHKGGALKNEISALIKETQITPLSVLWEIREKVAICESESGTHYQMC